MNLDILSDNFLIYASIIFTAVIYYVISNLYKIGAPGKSKSNKVKAEFKKKSLYIFAGSIPFSIVLATIIRSVVGNITDSEIPGSFIIMCLPFTVLVYFLFVALFVKKKLRIISSIALVLGLLFTLTIINDYYRYYPTLGEVFGKYNIKYQQNIVTLHYRVSTNQVSYNNQSLQSSLDSLNSAPTSGHVYSVNIPGTVSKFNARTAYVYEPAIYNELPQINLPVIILTAGVPGNPGNWIGLGLQGIMDQFASSHKGVTPLVFAVDSTGTTFNDTECVNSPRGNVETYLTTDVPNYIKKNFRVDTQPKNWAIGGLSLGGMCAVMLTLRHTNVYNYFIDLGGEIGPEDGSKQETIDTLFGGSEQSWAQHQPLLLLANNKYSGIGGFFGTGSQDSLSVTTAISELYSASQAAGLDTVKELINGQHTFNVWAQTYKDSLPWISNRIGATTCSGSCF